MEGKDLKGVERGRPEGLRLDSPPILASQMTDARWGLLNVRLVRSDKPPAAVLRAAGRTLEFDGYLKVSGVSVNADDQTLPELPEGTATYPFCVRPEQKFSSPSRYSEASLVKQLEEEGIGRPSTYASIISVIQDRNYVELVGKSFHATDIGEAVTDVMMASFPNLMSLDYTKAAWKMSWIWSPEVTRIGVTCWASSTDDSPTHWRKAQNQPNVGPN